jgi:hypothetical protein
MGSGEMSGDSRGLSTLVYWVGLRSLQLPTAKGEVEEDERDRRIHSAIFLYYCRKIGNILQLSRGR